MKSYFTILSSEMAAPEENNHVKELDEWIQQLYEKKQLAENQVKTLCEKVQACGFYFQFFRKDYCQLSDFRQGDLLCKSV